MRPANYSPGTTNDASHMSLGIVFGVWGSFSICNQTSHTVGCHSHRLGAVDHTGHDSLANDNEILGLKYNDLI